MEWVYNLKDINSTAVSFLQVAGGARVFALHGDLGAGKTSFVHALCANLQVTDPVTSPTFSIINQYDAPPGVIYHIDLYRLSGAEEASRAGVEDCLYSGERCFVEWPERAPDIFPPETCHAWFEVLDEQTRRLRISS